MSTKKVQTIADIARLAGVSKSTVSRALSGSSLIGEQTKERIRQIARQHNYQINVPAQRLSMQQSHTIAFVTCAYHKLFSVADLFTLEILGGITEALKEQGYDLLMVFVDSNESSWAGQHFNSGKADGFILMASTHKQYHMHALVETGAPFVVWGMPHDRYSFSTVNGDNFGGGRLAAQRLIELGKQRIAFLGGPQDEREVQLRYDGYAEALQAAGLALDPALVAYGDFSNTSGAAAMHRLLAQAPDLDAVFVNSDLMAVEAMKVLQAAGRRIPEQVAVVGYDDLSIAAQCSPQLTTISQHIHLAGKLLAQTLLQHIHTGVVTHVTVPVELVVRQSA